MQIVHFVSPAWELTCYHFRPYVAEQLQRFESYRLWLFFSSCLRNESARKFGTALKCQNFELIWIPEMQNVN